MKDHILVPLHGISERLLRRHALECGSGTTVSEAAHGPTAPTEVP